MEILFSTLDDQISFHFSPSMLNAVRFSIRSLVVLIHSHSKLCLHVYFNVYVTVYMSSLSRFSFDYHDEYTVKEWKHCLTHKINVRLNICCALRSSVLFINTVQAFMNVIYDAIYLLSIQFDNQFVDINVNDYEKHRNMSWIVYYT